MEESLLAIWFAELSIFFSLFITDPKISYRFLLCGKCFDNYTVQGEFF
jgi:hypothetical protein